MKNFLKGYADALTILPDKNFPKIDAKEILSVSDEEALRKDWEEVGNHIRSSIRKLENDR